MKVYFNRISDTIFCIEHYKQNSHLEKELCSSINGMEQFNNNETHGDI